MTLAAEPLTPTQTKALVKEAVRLAHRLADIARRLGKDNEGLTKENRRLRAKRGWVK